MPGKIWVYLDHFKGEVHASTWEVMGAGQLLANELGSTLTGVVVGSQVAAIADTAFHYGASEVFLADSPILEDYRSEPYADVISKLAKEHNPEVILFPTTTRGRELAAFCAVDLNTGILPDVIALDSENGSVLATRPVYAGKVLAKVKCNQKPQLITLRTRAFAKPEEDQSKTGEPTPVEVSVDEESIHTKVVGYKQSEGGASLSDANVIISGGRGVSNNPSLTPPDGLDEKEVEIWRAHEGFKMIEALAEVLGGAVGASRAAVDAGYIPYEHQVGQTGKVVTPDLYIACGISGAIQHLAGMRTSKVIVAINKDAEAPIFKLARFGVVGDLYDIIPPLTEALRKRLGK